MPMLLCAIFKAQHRKGQVPACNVDSILVSAVTTSDCWQQFRPHELRVGKWQVMWCVLS
jgi:hypothetical protein